MPNLRFDLKNVWVKGPPWWTTIIVASISSPCNGGTVYSLDVYEDSQAVAAGLAKQAQAGIEEAAAPKIES